MVNKRRARGGSQAAVFKAAAQEFAHVGYDAARVDRIAAKARLNKAMLYYHYGSKPALYLEVLRDMFKAVGLRARTIADGPGDAEAKLDAWIVAIVEEAAARPWFPPIMLREMASGAEHIDAETFGMMNAVFGAFHAIFVQGQQERRFRDAADPLLTYLTILPPILIFFARQRVLSQRRNLHTLAAAAPRTVDDFTRHMQSTARAMLRRET